MREESARRRLKSRMIKILANDKIQEGAKGPKSKVVIVKRPRSKLMIVKRPRSRAVIVKRPRSKIMIGKRPRSKIMIGKRPRSKVVTVRKLRRKTLNLKKRLQRRMTNLRASLKDIQTGGERSGLRGKRPKIRPPLKR